TVASLATTTHSRPITGPTPVMMPAAGMSSPYMPKAASCENSRNGAPGSISVRTRSRGRSLPRARCRSRAASPPPLRISATRAARSSTWARIAAALAQNASERVSSAVLSTGMGARFLPPAPAAGGHAQPPCKSRPGAASEKGGRSGEPAWRQRSDAVPGRLHQRLGLGEPARTRGLVLVDVDHRERDDDGALSHVEDIGDIGRLVADARHRRDRCRAVARPRQPRRVLDRLGEALLRLFGAGALIRFD